MSNVKSLPIAAPKPFNHITVFHADGTEDEPIEIRSSAISEDGLFLHLVLTDNRRRVYVIDRLTMWEIS